MPIPDAILPHERKHKDEIMEAALAWVKQWRRARDRVKLTLAAMEEVCPEKRRAILERLDALWKLDE